MLQIKKKFNFAPVLFWQFGVFLSNVFFGLMLFFVLFLLASAAFFYLYLVPNINQFTPFLENLASKNSATTVKIGRISTESMALIPLFSVHDLSIQPPSDSSVSKNSTFVSPKAALTIHQLQIAVSPWSLLKGNTEQIYIDAPNVEVQHDAQGNWKVAGIPLLNGEKGNQAVAGLDWVLSQPDWQIKNGTVRWIEDANANQTAMVFHSIDVVLRNVFDHHQMRLDALPPADWQVTKEPLTMRAVWQQPIFTLHPSDWQKWTGNVFLNVPLLQPQTKTPSHLKLQALAHIKAGHVVASNVDLDVLLPDFAMFHVGDGVKIDRIQGSFSGNLDWNFSKNTLQKHQQTPGEFIVPIENFGLKTKGLNIYHSKSQFNSAKKSTQFYKANPSGIWNTGEISFVAQDSQGKLNVSRVHLQQIMPFVNAMYPDWGLSPHAIKGEVNGFQANYKGDWRHPNAWHDIRIKGVATGLQWLPQGEMVGLKAKTSRVSFEATPKGGTAKVLLKGAQIEAPTWFAEPSVSVNHLDTNIDWHIEEHVVDGVQNTSTNTNNKTIEINATQLHFYNMDAKGSGKLTWRSQPQKSAQVMDDLGFLDLDVRLTHANVAQTWRYLPKSMPIDARNYIHDALTKGTAHNVSFRVKGQVAEIPFYGNSLAAQQGIFNIHADITDTDMVYVPLQLQQAEHGMHWSPLQNIAGQIDINKKSLKVKANQFSLQDAPLLKMSPSTVQILDLENPIVEVATHASADLMHLLKFALHSPIAPQIESALQQATGNGSADVDVILKLPLANINQIKIAGAVVFNQNDIRLSPKTPLFTQAVGTLHFNENGFSIPKITAKFAGGEVQMNGGSVHAAANSSSNQTMPSVKIQAKGALDVTQILPLLDLKKMHSVLQPFLHTERLVGYDFDWQLLNGNPQWVLQSDLQGVSWTLPEPLRKLPNQVLPLRLTQNDVTHPATSAFEPEPESDWHLTLGDVIDAKWRMKSRENSNSIMGVTHADIRLGNPSSDHQTSKKERFNLDVRADSLNADEWENIISRLSIDTEQVSKTQDNATEKNKTPKIILHANKIQWRGQVFDAVTLKAHHDKNIWQVNMHATQFDGDVLYNPEKITARFKHLTLTPFLQSTTNEYKLPRNDGIQLPAVDATVEKFQFGGRDVGRVEIFATNERNTTSNEPIWNLQRFNINLTEAKLTATGQWEGKKSAMNFNLDIADSGQLLNRFGQKDVLLGGKGVLSGHVAWPGSPLDMKSRLMIGQFNINLEKGQFLKVEPGAAKLLSVLSLQSLTRRLNLDFRDVFSKGFVFDFVHGDINVAKGSANTHNLQMSGINATVLMDGTADIATETQDVHVVLAPEINAGVVSLVVATALNPAVGLSTFLAQLFLRQPLMAAATREYRIQGPWITPIITDITNLKKATQTIQNQTVADSKNVQ